MSVGSLWFSFYFLLFLSSPFVDVYKRWLIPIDRYNFPIILSFQLIHLFLIPNTMRKTSLDPGYLKSVTKV